MNIFYYTVSHCDCRLRCNFLTCEKRCLSILENLPPIDNLKILPGSSRFNTLSSMELRSGDIIILYAGDDTDMKALLTVREFFEAFRVILIVGREELLQYGNHYSLTPRYTAILGKNTQQLSAVIDRIKAGNTNDTPGSTLRLEESSYA